jgi:hypothetical protein
VETKSKENEEEEERRWGGRGEMEWRLRTLQKETHEMHKKKM